MRTVRVSDKVFEGVRKIADVEGISMASVIERMLTYSCKVCGGPVFPDDSKAFRVFMTGKKKAFENWGHTVCLERQE